MEVYLIKKIARAEVLRGLAISALSAVVAVVFLWAGINKIMNYKLFVQALAIYESTLGFPFRSLTVYIGPFVILSEIWIGIGLLVPAWRKLGAMSGSILLVFLGGIVTLTYLKGAVLPCGCFLPFGSQQPGLFHIIQDLLMFLVLIWISHSKSEQYTAPRERFGRTL